MMFSVISNPATAPDFTRLSTRAVETGDVLALLADRQFHVCGQNMRGEAPTINPEAGGAFLVGKNAPKFLSDIRRANPLLPLVVEPRSFHLHWASAGEPFMASGTPGMFAMSLEDELNWQRMEGSDLAITPTGQIRAGDSSALKAALAAANALDRKDVMLALPMAAGWLSEEQHLKQLIVVINRSRHPVLLMFSGSGNPVGSVKRLRAYRRLFSEVTTPTVAYRADLVGFDAIAHGALASAIGSYPSLRRITPVGQRGVSIDREDMSPHMFIPDMLRFARSTHMRREWFAGTTSIQCFCVVCRGQDLDRLHGSNAERDVGHMHNVVSIDDLYSSHIGLGLPARRELWRRQAAGALDTYPQLETHIGRPLKVDPALTFWAS
ncbi:hypothetical protein C3B59_08275 [Cryobacterium zongtaii]|uniref:Uncharacterized protein n=1 Tax=Cryobacterium zongtaii TaxID=1259217 RepID=A0A2S3ZG97_9MICO|nr:hypothetical protein [Cryobacterium zongtaii]POH66411.1 hypothetical protein C3B59_08275 [Cryobacterium zongtaii]